MHGLNTRGPGFEIGGRWVGEGAPVFFVAELSANHGGKLETALATVEAAAKAGADAIKLQTYTPDTLTLKSDAEPFIVRTKNVWAGRTLHDLYAEAMTPWEWHTPLKAAAEAKGLLFFSTPFDPTATDLLEALDVPVHKVASFELTDLPLVEHVARRGKPMILSTGMASLGEIEAAVATCRAAGNDQLALLRCVSCYPANPESMNLRSYGALSSFGTVIGLSDHTRDATVAIASVALGAKIIEKHFILDRAIGGPDSFFSLEPADFRMMVDAVRATEAALGRPRFGPAEEERASTAFRRSLFVARDVAAGEVLTAQNIRSVRPSRGLPPSRLPDVLGRVAHQTLTAGTPLQADMVGARDAVAPVELRPAAAADSDFFFQLRNDETTRAASISSSPVERETHDAWYAAALEAPRRRLFAVIAHGTTAGQVRLDLEDHGAATLSIAVAPELRGRGVGAGAMRAAEETALGLGVSFVRAVIRADNRASLKMFERAGYYHFRPGTEAGAAVLRCERRIGPPPL